MKKFILAFALAFFGFPVEAAYTPQPTDTFVTGNITTQNLVPAGTATAASAVELPCNSKTGATVQVTGTYTGALSLQGTLGTTWVTSALTAAFRNINTDAYSTTIASATQSVFQISCMGLVKIRITALAAVTGTATVSINAVAGETAVFLSAPLPAGTAVLGHAIIDTGSTTAVTGTLTGVTTVATVSAVTSATLAANQVITPVPQAGQGASTTHKLVVAGTTNATSVKASAGVVNFIVISNTSAAVKFVKFYNKASAPTVGTDVPVLTVLVPAGQTVQITGGTFGARFSTGIAYATTNLSTDADTTAVTAGDLIVNIWYT